MRQWRVKKVHYYIHPGAQWGGGGSHLPYPKKIHPSNISVDKTDYEQACGASVNTKSKAEHLRPCCSPGDQQKCISGNSLSGRMDCT